ncbi:hypothetical protein ZIOFF_015617 [Zingiber officinale]|uniref:PHD finger protein ALFIN-LIKE n=1 Tax=Zingiber officinale TaxID=94328 RepID=A0A8J5HD83_ZINOF|nr:hypothetical protein ZIOFF_015617 [Zingiber officinale]
MRSCASPSRSFSCALKLRSQAPITAEDGSSPTRRGFLGISSNECGRWLLIAMIIYKKRLCTCSFFVEMVHRRLAEEATPVACGGGGADGLQRRRCAVPVACKGGGVGGLRRRRRGCLRRRRHCCLRRRRHQRLAEEAALLRGEAWRKCMDGDEVPRVSRSHEEVFRDFRGRRAGIIKALTTGIRWRSSMDSVTQTWEVNLPAEEVPPELPEPALGINFARDGMEESDWLALVAVHSDAWLLAVAFYFGARFGFNKESSQATHDVVAISDTAMPYTAHIIIASPHSTSLSAKIPSSLAIHHMRHCRCDSKCGAFACAVAV